MVAVSLARPIIGHCPALDTFLSRGITNKILVINPHYGAAIELFPLVPAYMGVGKGRGIEGGTGSIPLWILKFDILL